MLDGYLKQRGNFGLCGLAARLKAQGWVSGRLGDCIPLAVVSRRMGTVIKLYQRQHFQSATLANNEVRNFPVEPRPDRPSGLAGQSAVIGDKGRKRYLRKHMQGGQGALQAIK